MGKFVRSFLWRNALWILCSVLITAIVQLYLYLIGISYEECFYILTLNATILLFCTILGLAMDYRHYRKIKSSAQRQATNNINLPIARDLQEELYQDMLETENINKKLAYELMDNKNREMQDYYSVWVHQIKTPIAAMQLLLQMENSRGIEEEQEFLKDTEQEIFRIEQYVNMALQYQKLQSSSRDYVLKENSLDEIIREAIRKYAKIIIRKKLQIKYDGTDKKIITDDKLCCFVIEQVISNAVKYSRKGCIIFDIIEENNWYYLIIKDQGIGINKEDIPRVFEKGYTGYNGHSDKRSTGIGLYLCKQLLDQMGHTIRIESEPGVGTSVWLGFYKKNI